MLPQCTHSGPLRSVLTCVTSEDDVRQMPAHFLFGSDLEAVQRRDSQAHCAHRVQAARRCLDHQIGGRYAAGLRIGGSGTQKCRRTEARLCANVDEQLTKLICNPYNFQGYLFPNL
jgi:hypothetical protein